MHFSLAPVVLVLLVAVIAVIACRRFNIPSMLGYLLVGFIAGPGVLHLIPQSSATDYLGEIGIVFLMFSIGLEFSLSKLNSMRRLVFGLGGLQIGITLAAVLGILIISQNTPFTQAFAVAGALVMSSTAIVSRILSEKTELGQQHGQMAMGVLLMQDIAVVPLMILLPALAGGNSGNLWWELSLAAVKMVLTLCVLFIIGSRVMTPWFRLVAKAKSSELFMINVLLVTLGIAYLTELEGLSLALGAFVAGMLLSETEYRFQVEDDIRPFRDILLGFFFITVGMKLNLNVLVENWPLVMILLAIIIPLKALIVFLIAWRMKHTGAESLKAALYLAQGGEFGFVILAVSGNLALISDNLEQAATAAILLSMIAAPFILNGSDKAINKLIKPSWDLQAADLQKMLIDTMSKSDHILLIGFGRGGQNIGRILAAQDIPYYALDLDAERVQIARGIGEPVAFGDAKRKEILEAAGLSRAQAVIITLNNMHETEHVLDSIMHLHPTMPVHVRAVTDDYIDKFTDLGAEEVISDTREASLALASFAMINSGLSYQRVHQIISDVRRSRYQILEGLISGSDDEESFYNEINSVNRYAFALPREAYAVGKSIRELPLNETQVKLAAVRRQTSQIRDFTPDFVLEPNDILIIIGRKEKIISFENWSLQGSE
ncbi:MULTISPECIES: monovalent cation:proton antiporter family protein [Neisseria]|uniref:Glutathione-regulated potassium-efflux system protein n=1 Tax=Neisseria canis TaxID=493 RepID=A0A1X3CQD1_9NEIS|nr:MULTISPECIES: monovalent cation:proton antiporter family protein [Neisseria]KPN71761.1 potassium transporter [Neisseria sp. 83E34]OSI09782.1 potassium transporter [Neisseria canis]VEF02953.1 glutathione-regulated potassium-efflux system protein [Neisseria canis]